MPSGAICSCTLVLGSLGAVTSMLVERVSPGAWSSTGDQSPWMSFFQTVMWVMASTVETGLVAVSRQVRVVPPAFIRASAPIRSRLWLPTPAG